MLVPKFEIYVDGEELSDLPILYIKIQQSVNLIDKAEIHIKEVPFADIPFSTFNSNKFKNGQIIKIHFLYTDHGKVTFNGIIASQTIDCDVEGMATLTIICFGSNRVLNYPMDTLSSIPLSLMPQLRFGANILAFSLQIRANPNSNRLIWLSGYIKIKGSVDAKINTRVSLYGFGSNISSDVYIAGINHIFENGEWISKLEIGKLETQM